MNWTSKILKTRLSILTILLSLTGTVSSVSAWAANVTPDKTPVPTAPPKADKPDKKNDPKPLPVIPVKEEDLVRAPFEYAHDFPWKKKSTAPSIPKTTSKKDISSPSSTTGNTMGDMTSEEIIVKALGGITSEKIKVKNSAGIEEEKEIMTFTKDVVIERIQTKNVLRAQRIRITTNQSTIPPQIELLEATGNVEVWDPKRSSRGESLVYETQFGPHREILKNVYTIEGDRAQGTRATLWQGEEQVEAEKIVYDLRLETVRITGNPVAIFSLPATPKDTNSNTAKVAPPETSVATSGGLLPSFSLKDGGKVHLECDGEIFYEGSAGRVKITRNVLMKTKSKTGQTAMKLNADEVLIALNLPPPGQPSDGNSLFSGDLKSLDFFGRVEIKFPGTTVLFDRGHMDMIKNTMLLEMKDTKQSIQFYSKDNIDDPGFVFLIPKSLLYNMTTLDSVPGGPMSRKTFEGDPPTNRPKSTPEKDKQPTIATPATDKSGQK